MCALDGDGRPAFYDLMKRQCQAVYYAFDILWLNGRDLRDLPLVERKKILRKVIPRKSSSVGCVSYVDRDALKLFELVKKSDLEGLVVKRKDGKYSAADALVQNLKSHLHSENRSAGIFSKTVGRIGFADRAKSGSMNGHPNGDFRHAKLCRGAR